MLKNFASGLLLILLLATGCSRPQPWDKQLVGSWKTVDDGKTIIATYNAHGTATMKTAAFDLRCQWKVVDPQKRLIKTWAVTITENDVQPEEVTFNGDTLLIKSSSGNLIFTRVPEGTLP